MHPPMDSPQFPRSPAVAQSSIRLPHPRPQSQCSHHEPQPLDSHYKPQSQGSSTRSRESSVSETASKITISARCTHCSRKGQELWIIGIITQVGPLRDYIKTKQTILQTHNRGSSGPLLYHEDRESQFSSAPGNDYRLHPLTHSQVRRWDDQLRTFESVLWHIL
jgi:hypothetical protein